MRPSGARRILIGTAAVFCLISICFAGYLAYDEFELRNAEIRILVRELAQTGIDRDRLSSERDGLMTERDRLSSERDSLMTERDRLSVEGLAERTRIQAAETTIVEIQMKLNQGTELIAQLQAQTKSNLAEVERLKTDAATLRSRLQSTQVEARQSAEAVGVAEAAQRREKAAREKLQRASVAFFSVIEASTALSKSRKRMNDILRDQIDAERANRFATASSLVREYNALVDIHNQQTREFNVASDNLAEALRP